MEQDEITALLLLRLDAAELAISALQLASEPAQQARAFQLLETLHSRMSHSKGTLDVLRLAQARLSPQPDDGES